MGSLTDAYERWRRHPFPTGSAADAVDELLSELALADAWVAESVIPFVERGVHDPAKIDVISELRDLSRRAADLQPSVGSDDRQLLHDYTDYLDALIEVYQDFLDSAPRSA